MYIKTQFWSVVGNNLPLSMRCPNCRHQGVLEGHGNVQDVGVGDDVLVGHRRCPNPDCLQHLFVVVDSTDDEIVVAYPPERLDFDGTNLPDPVREALEEAIACHAAEAYNAAGMMVRKTLELLCNEQGAEGGNLYDRIEALRENVVLPQGLMDGLHHLRLLGNDAAHVESRVYEQVGKEEVELAMDVAKEVLKSVYQLSDLVNRLRSRQRPDTS